MINGKPDMEALAQPISLMTNILGFDFLWHTACERTAQSYRTLRTPKNNVPGRRLWLDCFGIHALP